MYLLDSKDRPDPNDDSAISRDLGLTSDEWQIT